MLSREEIHDELLDESAPMRARLADSDRLPGGKGLRA